jgi:AcrR family transcriptional regulator
MAKGGGRDALIKASVEIIAEEGLRNLTYRNVAQRAGVTHGLVRHHFGTREALIKIALEFSVARSIHASGLQNPISDIDEFAIDLAASITRDPGEQVFQYELILQSTRQLELKPLVERLHAQYRGAILAELTLLGFGEDTPLANLVFAALDGLVFQQVALGDARVTEDALSRLRDMLSAYRATIRNVE